MRAVLATADALLKGTPSFDPEDCSRSTWRLPALILLFSPLYGAAMGSYHLDSPDRLWQVAFAAAKVPLLLTCVTLLCLPAFFVLNTLLGLRHELSEALRTILAGQAALSIALAALGPLTATWYLSVAGYRAALLFNAAMFALATVAGHVVTLRGYRPLMARHNAHSLALYAWLISYTFVGIQMGWMLRPFVGTPDLPVSFFRPEPFDNAYVVVLRLILG